MASPALAEVSDLAARLGVATGDLDTPRAQANLSDASTLVRQVTGLTYVVDVDADPLVLDTAAVTDVVEMVVLAAAKRAYENPTGVTQKSTGDVSMSFSARAESAVYLTDGELRMLRASVGRSGLSTISTTRGDTSVETGYVPIVGTTAEFPWYDPYDELIYPL